MAEARERSITDPKGNHIIVVPVHPFLHNIFLKLHSEQKRRLIGQLDKRFGELIVRRQRGRHLYRKNNSYGFNYYILSTARTFSTVMLHDDYNRWRVPVADILANKDFKYHKEQGFEVQVFMSLEALEPYKLDQLF